MQVDTVNVKAKMDSMGVLQLHERGHNIKNLILREREKLRQNLRIIDIRWKKVGDTLATELSTLTKQCRNLVTIDLSDNYIGDSGCRELASAVATHATLKTLNLGGNRIGDLGAATISSMLMMNATLKELDMSGNDLKKVGIQGIGGGMRVNTGLTALRLVENFFGDEGAVELGWALSYNSTLQHLYIRSNDISNAGVAMLSSGIVRNEALRSLDLGDNDVSDRGATSLADALGNNTVLRHLDLTLNEIGSDGKDALLDAMDFTSWSEAMGEEYVLALVTCLHPRLGGESELQSILAVPPNAFKRAIMSGKKISPGEKQALVRAERTAKPAEAKLLSVDVGPPRSALRVCYAVSGTDLGYAAQDDSPLHRIIPHCIHRRQRTVLFDGLQEHAQASAS